MLAELMRLKYGIAIAACTANHNHVHGGFSVAAGGLIQPSLWADAWMRSAPMPSWHTQYLVAEADESDRSFLKLSPILAL